MLPDNDANNTTTKTVGFVSRRYFTTCAIAGALLASRDSVAQESNDGQLLSTAPNPAAASLKTKTDASDLLTINVYINGEGPFQFVVDTCAERSLIASEIAERLNLPRASSLILKGLARDVRTDTVQVSKLSFGPFTRSGIRVPVLPRLMMDADGYLGLDVINGTRVSLDFKNRVLIIEPSETRIETAQSLQPDTTRVPLFGSQGRLRIRDCAVDSVPVTAFIDSGAEVSVGNTALLKALVARYPKRSITGSVSVSGVTGGAIVGGVINIERIRLQALSFNKSAVVIAKVNDFDDWGLRQTPALLIGMNLLRQFACVTIDYRTKELLFTVR